MKTMITLLFIVCVSAGGKAQQILTDSLLVELKKYTGEDTIRLNLLNKIAAEYHTVNPSKGLEIADAAIALAQKLNIDEKLAVAYTNKALNYNSKGDRKPSIENYNKAITISKRSGLKKLEAATYHNIGIVYFDMSDYAKAMELQEQSLNMAGQIEDSMLMARAYISIGVIYQFVASYPEALRHQQNALAIFSKLDYKQGIFDAFTNIGIVYANMSNLQKALEYYEKAVGLNKLSGNKQAMANVLGNMGNLYDNLDDSTNALQYYKEALAISEAINYKFGIASNTANIGILYSYYSHYNIAIAYLKKALILYRQLNDKNNQSLIYYILAEIYTDAPTDILVQNGVNPARRYDTAIKYNEKALALAREIKALGKQVNALESLSRIYEKQNNYKEALEYYKQASTINDTIFNDNKKQQITRLEMQFEFNKTQDSIKVVTSKQQALAKAEIQKQQVIKNSLIGGIGFLILATTGGFILYKRNRDISAKKNEAELNAKITDVEMKALRAQMNPHFIFNSLNSIADYIDKHQIKTASDFTAKFAKLMRMVLENSEHREVPLSDDLKALELYMQLERFRLRNKFDYIIKLDSNIDADNTLVPPLILQPFIENSIWHGIAKKEGHGNISIYIKQDKEMISCVVEDNGEGIKEKEIPAKEKKSLGMRITKERIDIINRQKKSNASMYVSNTGGGVKAEVRLPLELSF